MLRQHAPGSAYIHELEARRKSRRAEAKGLDVGHAGGPGAHVMQQWPRNPKEPATRRALASAANEVCDFSECSTGIVAAAEPFPTLNAATSRQRAHHGSPWPVFDLCC